MPKPPTDFRRCTATTKAGGPCPAPALKDGAECFHHSDSTRQDAQLARMLGGKSAARVGRNFRANVIKLDSPQDWLDAISLLLLDVSAMPNGTNRAQVFVSLSKEAREWTIMREAMSNRRVIDGKAVRR